MVGVPGDRRKAVASGAAPRTHNGGEARGKGYREGGRGCTPWGDIGGRRQEQERKRGRRDEAKRFGVS